jgi:glycosyltransferase involved in cell wall biosynthesis
VHAQEARTLKRVDHLFTCSDQDRDQFIDLYGISPSKITVVPNGVDTRTEPPDKNFLAEDSFWQANVQEQSTLFFMGKLDYEPNVRALDFLNRELMPELDRLSPGAFKVVVCGGPVPRNRFHHGIAFAGSVDDRRLQAYMHGASMCLAPIFTGSGTRLKILEYLSAARPVVATPKAAEGIPCESGTHLVIAEADAFTDAIRTLAQDSARSDSIAQSGRNLVREMFDWTAAVQPKWRSILDQWCNFTPAPPWPGRDPDSGSPQSSVPIP